MSRSIKKNASVHQKVYQVVDGMDAATFDDIERERKKQNIHFHELVKAYGELLDDDLGLHFAATQRALDKKGHHGINPERRLTGADRLVIARIALGTASAYIKQTGDGFTVVWDSLDEVTRMELTTFIMNLHRQYNDPTFAHVSCEVLGKLGLGSNQNECAVVFIETCKTLIRLWLKTGDNEYIL